MNKMNKNRNIQKKGLIWQYLQEEAAQKEADDYRKKLDENLDNMYRLLQNPEALQRIRDYFGYRVNQNYTKRRKCVPEKLSVGIRKSISEKDLELLN
jgi:hypothetical protein